MIVQTIVLQVEYFDLPRQRLGPAFRAGTEDAWTVIVLKTVIVSYKSFISFNRQ